MAWYDGHGFSTQYDWDTTDKPTRNVYKHVRMIAYSSVSSSIAGDGSCLYTLSLRPNVMYGEGDPYFIPNPLKIAKQNCGKLPRIGNGQALFQQVRTGVTSR